MTFTCFMLQKSFPRGILVPYPNSHHYNDNLIPSPVLHNAHDIVGTDPSHAIFIAQSFCDCTIYGLCQSFGGHDLIKPPMGSYLSIVRWAHHHTSQMCKIFYQHRNYEPKVKKWTIDCGNILCWTTIDLNIGVPQNSQHQGNLDWCWEFACNMEKEF